MELQSAEISGAVREEIRSGRATRSARRLSAPGRLPSRPKTASKSSQFSRPIPRQLFVRMPPHAVNTTLAECDRRARPHRRRSGDVRLLRGGVSQTAGRSRCAGQKSHVPHRSASTRRSLSIGHWRPGFVRGSGPHEHVSRTRRGVDRFHGGVRRTTRTTRGAATARSRRRRSISGSSGTCRARRCEAPDSLQKISQLRVVERVQLAMKGTREARNLLIRDSCRVVQRAVLQSPQLTGREVEGFAAMTSLSDETLRLIANNRKFRKNYTVTRALVNNPKPLSRFPSPAPNHHSAGPQTFDNQ